MRHVASSGVCLTVAILFLWVLPTQTVAQQTAGPEHQRLSSLVGEWTYEDSYETGTSVCEWLGTTFVVCQQVFTEPSGTTVPVLHVYGYDADEEAYTMYSFYGRTFGWGSSASAMGWVEDNTWTFVWADNPVSLMRLTMLEEKPSSVSLKWEYSRKGGPWQAANEATLTRVK
jgi:hypothetical protein